MYLLLKKSSFRSLCAQSPALLGVHEPKVYEVGGQPPSAGTVELLLLHRWDVLTFGQQYLGTTEVYTGYKMINSLRFFDLYRKEK